MVIVHLKGGLGNQMFQYAAGRALALRRDEPLLFNTRSFPISGGRSYALDHYCTVGELAPARTVRRLTRQGYGRYADALLRKANRLLGTPPAVVRERKPFQYDPELFADLPADVYLEGYWQNERYFQDIAGTIRRELTLRAPPEGMNAQLLTAIEGCTAVSLHVRRGDYVANQAALAFHGICPPAYYRRAIEIIQQRAANPHFFVFSDDIAWVKANLPIPEPATYVAHNGPEAAHEDLRLLQACKHHIIANSTFSWWGAWLSDGPNKMVVAPRRWLNDPRYDASDLVPANWLRLDGEGAA
jgi:hypothetical protein